MAGSVRSLFESGDGLELALDAKRRTAISEAEHFDHLLGYLSGWEDEPIVATAGGEELHRFGGSGTPKVAEFAVCEIASALDLSPAAGAALVADILDLEYRLPRLYACLHRGVVEAWRVRMAATATRGLSLWEATVADVRLSAETVGDGTPMLCRVNRTRLKHILAQIRANFRPDGDNESEDAQSERRVTVRPVGDGLAELYGLIGDEDGARLDQRLEQIVGWLRALGDDRTHGVLRSVAVGYLTEPDSLGMLHDQVTAMRAHPSETADTTEPETPDDADAGAAEADAAEDADEDTGAAGDTDGAAADEGPDDGGADDEPDDGAAAGGEVPEAFRRHRRRLPQTLVYLHLDRESGTWSMDGVGPISRAEAEQIIGHSRVTLKPVIDLAQNITYTGYVAPPKLKEQTALANAGFCTFPSCNRPARTGDYDHIVDYREGGRTDARNGHRLCRFHHRAKTFTDWTVRSPAPGTWLWASPAGRIYLVTGGTTTRLDEMVHHRRTNAA